MRPVSTLFKTLPSLEAPYEKVVPVTGQFLSRPRPHVGTEPKVEISPMNHPQGRVCCSKVI